MTPARGEPGIFFSFLTLLSIVLSLIVYVLLAIWIYKDAEKRKKSWNFMAHCLSFNWNFRDYYLANRKTKRDKKRIKNRR